MAAVYAGTCHSAVAIAALFLLGMRTFAFADSLDVWAKRTSGVGNNLYGVAYGDGRYVCAGQAGTLLVSSNGNSWQAVSSNVTNDLFGIEFSDGRYVAVGTGGLILKSTNAVDWFPQASPTTKQLNGVGHGGGLFLATGNTGTLLTSPDGSAWTERNSGTTRALVGCAFGNDTFLAVGQGQSNPGAALTSSNAVDWVDRSYPQLGVAFYGVAFGHGVFVAMDARGVAYTSTNGINWSSRWTVTSDYVFGITFAQNMFVGVGGPFGGGSQKIVTSPDGDNWKLRPISTTNSASLRAVTYGNGYFIAVGDKGLIVQSDPVFTLRLAGFPGGVPSLVLDGESGRAYCIQTCSDLAGLNWTDVFAVTNTTEAQSYLDTQANSAPIRFYRGVTP